jgi:hypothetical protein
LISREKLLIRCPRILVDEAVHHALERVSVCPLLLAGRALPLVIGCQILILRDLLVEELHLHQLVVMSLSSPIVGLPLIRSGPGCLVKLAAQPALTLAGGCGDYVAPFEDQLLVGYVSWLFAGLLCLALAPLLPALAQRASFTHGRLHADGGPAQLAYGVTACILL